MTSYLDGFLYLRYSMMSLLLRKLAFGLLYTSLIFSFTLTLYIQMFQPMCWCFSADWRLLTYGCNMVV
jgi:hypothetical protein